MKTRAIVDGDCEWIRSVFNEHWASSIMVTRGTVHQADQLPGFIAYQGKRKVGLITYIIRNSGCEIVSLNSLETGRGIGSLLVKKTLEFAASRHCNRVWLITTNDNSGALIFFQKSGFKLVAVHRNAISQSRSLKPAIPETGHHGIPIRDEIELEIMLAQ